MKILLAVLLSAGVGFAGAYVYVSNQKNAQLRAERAAMDAEREAEKDKLEKDLKRARSRPVAIETVNTTNTVEVAVSDRKSPRQILEKLATMKPGAGSDNQRFQSIRRIVHELESLADHGGAALPAIREFLALNQDVSYERERNPEQNNQGQPGQPGQGPGGQGQGGGPGGPGGGGGPGGPGGGPGFGGFGGGPGGGFREALTTRTESYYPYSLRLGLFDVVKGIGGPEAESIFLEVLSTTGRGVEVAHIGKMLEEMATGKYRNAIISAAHELLRQPVEIPNPTDLDRQSKAFLYGILAELKDTSFAPIAQTLLVSADGRIDRSALAYLNEVMKEQALPALYQAYRDVRITNNFEKASVIGAAMNYAGINPTADQMFKELMASDNQMRFMALFRMNDGDVSPDVLKKRIELLEASKAAITDERLAEGFDRAIQGINRRLDPATASQDGGNRFRGGFGGRDAGGPGGFGGRGGDGRRGP